MPNSTRTIIRNKLNQAENHVQKVTGALSVPLEHYSENNLEISEIVSIVQYVQLLASENEGIDAMNLYVILSREGEVPDLGRYRQHLFHLASIIILAKQLENIIIEFKRWEATPQM